MSKIFSLFISAVSGITMAVQGTVNAQLSQKTNIWEATFLVHFIGAFIVAAIMFMLKVGSFRFSKWLGVPWYLYSGAFLSVAIIYLVALSIPKVGVSNATTAIIVGQVTTAVIIDHFGLFGVSKIAWTYSNFLGIALFAAGAKLLMH